MTTVDRLVGAGIDRIDGPAKVRGTAPYAYEQDPGEPIAHLAVVQSTVNRGRISRLGPPGRRNRGPNSPSGRAR